MIILLKIDDVPVMNVRTLALSEPDDDPVFGWLNEGCVEVFGVFLQSKRTIMDMIHRRQAMKFKIEWTYTADFWRKFDAIIFSYQTGRRDEFDLGTLVFRMVGDVESPPIDPALHAAAMEAMRALGFDDED